MIITRNVSAIIIITAFLLFWVSCGNCDDAANYYRKKSFNIILKSNPSSGRAYSIKGINPVTGKDEKYYDDGGFLGLPFADLIAIGDTLVKKNGELKVYIHKKDTILIFPFKCEGAVYN